MLRVLSFVFGLLFISITLLAQDNTSAEKILTTIHKNKLVVVHKVKSGETLFMLARRYHVPPAMLADANGLNYQSGLGKIVYIPLGAYNRKKVVPSNLSQARPLYYKAGRFDNLYIIAKYASVKQKVIQGWNNMADNKISEGQLLKVGWVLYDATQLPFARKDTSQNVTGNNVNNTVKTVVTNRFGQADTIITIKAPDTLSKIEKKYLSQTSDETLIIEEKGSAVFFEMPVKSSSNKVYYAFHNKAPRGAVIKVVNPGTNKKVFVKVLGNVPNTKQYYNALIGISENAKKELGITENKAWCELTYWPR